MIIRFSDYSDTQATRILNAELADTYGNLLSRACAKVVNPAQIVPGIDRIEFDGISRVDVTQRLIDLLQEVPDNCRTHFDAYDFYKAVDEVIKVLHTANNFMETFKPWELRKDPNATRRLHTVLRIVFETLRITSIILQPVVPQMSSRLLDKINVDQHLRSWNDLKVDWTGCDETNVRSLTPDTAILFKRMK